MGFAYDFDWGVLWRQPYGMWLLQGIWLTLKIGFLAWIIAFFLGIFVGTLRVTPGAGCGLLLPLIPKSFGIYPSWSSSFSGITPAP